MGLLILFFVVVLSVSFLCSILEAVFLSLTHSHVVLMGKQGKRSGRMLVQFKERVDRPLAAILTLNTVANTLGSAGVGAQTLHLYGSKWVALASAVLTFSILIFSEIVPKTLGAVYWKQLAPVAAYLIQGLIIMTYPFVVVIEVISKKLSANRVTTRITRDEVIVAAEIGEDEGELHWREETIIKNLLRLDTMHVKDILTPRSVTFALPVSMTAAQVVQSGEPLIFSRIPVYGENMDDILGMVYRLELYQTFSYGDPDTTLENLLHPIQVTPVTKTVAGVLEEFINQREHMFLVVDEYGGTAGLITLEDTIETLLGVEIVDESDSVEDLQEYARRKWARRRLEEDI